MTQKVKRNYIEIIDLKDLKEVKNISKDYSIKLINPSNFQLNKFFYKNIGKEHQWVDRLTWTERQWIEYLSDKKVKTYILKKIDDLAGYFELILHQDEVEIAYFGLLEEYRNQKLGSYLLSSAIKNSFLLLRESILFSNGVIPSSNFKICLSMFIPYSENLLAKPDIGGLFHSFIG